MQRSKRPPKSRRQSATLFKPNLRCCGQRQPHKRRKLRYSKRDCSTRMRLSRYIIITLSNGAQNKKRPLLWVKSCIVWR